MKKHLKLIAALLLLSTTLLAQEEDEPKQNPWFVGGSFGVGFSDVSFNVTLSPQVGYRVKDYFAVGSGINFRYSGVSSSYKSRLGVAGLNVFSRLYPFRYIMLQVQPEANYVWGKDIYENPRTVYRSSKVVPNLLVGGGAVLPSGGGEMIIGVFYDLLQDNTFYGSKPFFRILYNVNLR